MALVVGALRERTTLSTRTEMLNCAPIPFAPSCIATRPDSFRLPVVLSHRMATLTVQRYGCWMTLQLRGTTQWRCGAVSLYYFWCMDKASLFISFDSEHIASTRRWCCHAGLYPAHPMIRHRLNRRSLCICVGFLGRVSTFLWARHGTPRARWVLFPIPNVSASYYLDRCCLAHFHKCCTGP
jgi:hypothetical protein